MRRRRSFPPLRRRLFLATALIVVASIGVTFAVGVILTRRASSANLDDLSHQADLLARREEQALFAFSNLKTLRAFLDRQNERIEVFKLAAPTPICPTSGERTCAAASRCRARCRRRPALPLRRAKRSGQGLRPAPAGERSCGGLGSFLRALLVAVLVGGVLAALGSLLIARAISRPVRRVAEASRSLAEGVSRARARRGLGRAALLASSFNEMAEQLQKAREAGETSCSRSRTSSRRPLAAIRGYAEALDEGVVGAEEAAATIREVPARAPRARSARPRAHEPP